MVAVAVAGDRILTSDPQDIQNLVTASNLSILVVACSMMPFSGRADMRSQVPGFKSEGAAPLPQCKCWSRRIHAGSPIGAREVNLSEPYTLAGLGADLVEMAVVDGGGVVADAT